MSKRQPRKPTKATKAAAATRSAAWLIALIIFVTAIAYANALDGPFIFDDSSSILENQTISDLGDLGRVLRPPFETPVAGRPFVNFSFALNHAAGGQSPTGYHVVNVLLHAACGLLLFGVVRRTTKATLLPLGIALVWVVHPLNTEAVNYITQRTELLMATCLMLTLYVSIRANESRATAWMVLSVAACTLGMASKETMVVAPVLVAAYDRAFVFPSWKAAWSARARLYVALAATWIILVWLGAGAGRSLSAGFSAHDSNPWIYLLNQTEIITRYLRLSLWPAGLAIDYGVPRSLTLAEVWPNALALTLLAAATVVAIIKRPKLGYLGLWFFLTLAPTSSILPIPTEVGAERRMYLPLMAIVSLAAAGAAALWNRRNGAPDQVRAEITPIGAGAIALACVVLTPVTWARNQEYQSALTLVETTVARYPTGAAESMYGTELAAAGRLMEAERHLRLGTSSYPPAHFYLATVLSAQGKADEAVAEFNTFISTQPPELAQVKTARLLSAEIEGRRGRWTEAAQQYRAILGAYPGDTTAQSLLANALVRLAQYAEAIPILQQLISGDSNNTSLINTLGVALISSGRIDEAIAAFQRVVDIEPGRPGARENLARAMAMRGK